MRRTRDKRHLPLFTFELNINRAPRAQPRNKFSDPATGVVNLNPTFGGDCGRSPTPVIMGGLKRSPVKKRSPARKTQRKTQPRGDESDSTLDSSLAPAQASSSAPAPAPAPNSVQDPAPETNSVAKAEPVGLTNPTAQNPDPASDSSAHQPEPTFTSGQWTAIMLNMQEKIQRMSICPMSYPSFPPTSSDPSTWLRTYTEAADFNKDSERERLIRVSSCLNGPAAVWHQRSAWKCKTWTEFENLFQERFIDEKTKRIEALRKLGKITKDPAMKYTHHLDLVVELCFEADPDMEPKDVIERSLKTLPPDEVRILAAIKPKTVNELHQHFSWLDRTVPFCNPSETTTFAEVNINQLSSRATRQRSPERRTDEARTRQRSQSRESQQSGFNFTDNAVTRTQLQPPTQPQPHYTTAQQFQPQPHYTTAQQFQPPLLPQPQYTAPARQLQPSTSYTPNPAYNNQSQPLQAGQHYNENGHYIGNRRTPDGRALCNYCNFPGHIIKNCRNRINGLPRASVWGPRQAREQTPTAPENAERRC